MISIVHNFEPDPKWNKRLLDSGLGIIYQTMERGSQLKYENRPTHFLKFLNETGKIIGQLLIDENLRYKQNNIKSKLIRKIPGIRKKVFNWLGGPIIFDNNYSAEIYSTLGNFLRSKNCIIDGWTNVLNTGDPSILQESFQIIKWGTYLIDLSKSKEEIFAKIDKKSGRKNIERSKNRGVKVEEITNDSLIEFHELINSMKEESGQPKTSYEILKLRWDLFQPVGFSGFLARKDDQPIGGLLFSYVNGHILEAGVARSKIDTQEKLYSQDLIKWKIIEWGIENKMRFFNLNGFNPNPTSEKEKGIRRYKEKWGGDAFYYYRILQKPNILTNRI